VESSTKISLKVTWLVSIIDRTRTPDDHRYSKLLLDDSEPISITVCNVADVDGLLSLLNEKYLKYDNEFVIKSLADFRRIGDLYEVVYVSTLNYVPGLNKTGTIYSIKELQQRKIEIGEFYERAIIRNGRGYR